MVYENTHYQTNRLTLLIAMSKYSYILTYGLYLVDYLKSNLVSK